MATEEIKTEIAGNVWKIVANVGDAVEEDDPIIILESMKMEIPVVATEDGKVVEIKVAEGDAVEEDQTVAIIET